MATRNGTGRDDTLNGTNNADDIYGGGGNDSLNGYGGNDSIYGGTGNDQLYGGAGNDLLYGGAGNDLLYGDDGNDFLDGGSGSNSLYGGAGQDTLRGGDGSQIDYLYGGTGLDYLDYSQVNFGVKVDFANAVGGTLRVTKLNGGQTIAHFSQMDGFIGTAYGDSVIGFDDQSTSANDTYTNVFYGNGGNDTMEGRGGDDVLYGGDDQDVLYGGAGQDSLYGDAGNDELYGGAGNDQLYGGDGDDLLSGGAGNDLLDGGAGNDRLYADGGADTLVGGAGNDTFYISANAGRVEIRDFGFGSTDVAGDEDWTNNDFINLHDFYNDTTLAQWNAANPNQTYKNPMQWMLADYADNQVLDRVAGGLIIRGPDGQRVQAQDLLSERTGVLCYARGTFIATARGQVAVEHLHAGDLVTTLDHGAQPLRWIGRRLMDKAELAANPSQRPWVVKAGSFGAGLPERDLVLSPQHRMLLRSRLVEDMVGAPEALVAIKHLAALEGVFQDQDCEEVEYFHLLFDKHQVIFAESTPSETLLLGPEARKMMSLAAWVDLQCNHAALLQNPVSPVRPLLNGKMGRKLARRMVRLGIDPLCAPRTIRRFDRIA